MKAFYPPSYLKYTWWLIAMGALLRLGYAQLFPLVPDEANYWQWSRYLAWGYHDQAPLIAWAIRLSTLLLGHTETAVRLPSIIAMSIASFYVALIARRWFSDRIAWNVTLLGQTMLLFNVGGLLATADGLQAAAWAGGAYHAARAFEANGWRQWLAAGTWVGIGLLSKYTMVLLPLFVFIFGLLSTPHRPLLMTIKPYVALLVALSLFSPVIGWNIANGWNSARHVAYIGGANQGFVIHWKFFGDFIGSQAALVSPLVFILVCAGWIRIIRGRYPSERWIFFFLFCISFPMIAGFGLLSLHTRVYGNWPGAGYLGAVLLTAAFWSPRSENDQDGRQKPSKRLWRWSIGISGFVTAVLLIQVVCPFMLIPAKYDRTAFEIRGWDQLGQRVEALIKDSDESEKPFIFGLNYQVASELAFYIPGQPRTVSINRWHRPNVYDYWWEDADLIGKNGIGVTDSAKSQNRLRSLFERVEPPVALDIHWPSIWSKAKDQTTLVNTWYIYRCYGFKGGLRWVPKSKGDIRAQ